MEQRLNQIVNRYRAQGYKVVVRPGPDDLPDFAKDFQVEIVGQRSDGNVLAAAKSRPSDLQADSNLPMYAEVTGNQPGWRFDLFVLGPESEWNHDRKDATEPSDEDIRRYLEDVERMLHSGFVSQSLIAAWAALESTMRKALRTHGEKADWNTSPRTMLNELFSAGAFTNAVFRELEKLFQLRSVIVHGFATPIVEPSSVRFLIETARNLLAESQLALPA